MKKQKTTRFDVAEHLRTPEEMAAYVEARFEEAGDDAAFIAKALGDIARAKDNECASRSLSRTCRNRCRIRRPSFASAWREGEG